MRVTYLPKIANTIIRSLLSVRVWTALARYIFGNKDQYYIDINIHWNYFLTISELVSQSYLIKRNHRCSGGLTFLGKCPTAIWGPPSLFSPSNWTAYYVERYEHQFVLALYIENVFKLSFCLESFRCMCLQMIGSYHLAILPLCVDVGLH